MSEFTLPTVQFKAPHDTDASLLLGAADKIERGFTPGGPNVTTAVVELIRRAVMAVGDPAIVCDHVGEKWESGYCLGCGRPSSAPTATTVMRVCPDCGSKRCSKATDACALCDEEKCETCNSTGIIECWNPGGPCDKPNDPDCDICGACDQCPAGHAPRTDPALAAATPEPLVEITERPCPHCRVPLAWIDDMTGYRCPRCCRYICVPRLRGRFSEDGTQWTALSAGEKDEER